MSYLGTPRLHFAGRFEADVPTLNNDIRHFDSSRFRPEHQQPKLPDHPAAWSNARGSGSWRLFDCRVRRVCFRDGSICQDPEQDSTVASQLTCGGTRVSAKIVDLDPQQPSASTIWGLTLELRNNGRPLLTGTFLPVPFADLWKRAQQGAGDLGMSAFYQSILTDIVLADGIDSPFLAQLAGAESLSIKFNLDGFNTKADSLDFATGRIVGTIGMQNRDEPRHFIAGRHFAPRPGSPVHFIPGELDTKRRKFVLDLGNALPTLAGGSRPVNLGTIALAAADGSQSFRRADFRYDEHDWYERTSGIVELPRDAELTEEELRFGQERALALIRIGRDWQPEVLAAENSDGLHVRADASVFRMSPGEVAEATLRATCLGKPFPNAVILCWLDPRGLYRRAGEPLVGVPVEGVQFASSICTASDGVAVLRIAAHDPGRPRGYVDGQVYAIRYALASQVNADVPNPSDCISVRVWDAVDIPDQPEWAEHIEPILRLYANLYPAMKPILDLASYDDVVAKAALLRMSLSLPIDDPNHMPVTRDLSPGKRDLILKWLATSGNGGLPNKQPAGISR